MFWQRICLTFIVHCCHKPLPQVSPSLERAHKHDNSKFRFSILSFVIEVMLISGSSYNPLFNVLTDNSGNFLYIVFKMDVVSLFSVFPV